MASGYKQYSKNIIDDLTKSLDTTYSSDKIESLLGNAGGELIKSDKLLTEKTIGNTQTTTLTIIKTLTPKDPFVNQLIYDTNEILGKINSIDDTKDEVVIETIHANISGGSGDAKLTEDIISNTACGAANSGTKFAKDTDFTTFAKMLLLKELAPTITVSATNSGTKEVGTTVNSSVFTLQITSLGTATPTDIEFYVGSTKVDTQSYISGTNSYTYTYTTPITSNTTIKGRLVYNKSDGTSTTLDASKSFTFVYASYYGVTTQDSTTITDTDVLAMSKTLLTAKAYTQNNINLNNERIVYCYPASYGNLTVIKDGNNFDVTSSFDKVALTINSVSYNCYILHDPTTDTGLKIVYS